jgi:cytochrome c-type biogenesis protein CcmH/NrfG
LLQQTGRLDPARRQFLRALDLDPHFTAAYRALIQIAGQQQEPGLAALLAPVVRDQQEAKRREPELRRRAYQSPADPSGCAALARYLEERGELREARAQWEMVLSLKPGDRTARQAVARLDRVLGVQ